MISSLGAVALSAVLGQILLGRRETKRSRSFIASCLAIHFVQSPAIEKYFSLLIGPGEGVSWTEETLPLLFDVSRRTKPYDIPFDKIHETLLNLDTDLADQIVKLEILIRYVNDWLIEDTQGYSSFSTQSERTKNEMLRAIQVNKKANVAISEFVGLLAQESRKARWRLFARKKKIFDWSAVDKKYDEVNNLFLEGWKSP